MRQILLMILWLTLVACSNDQSGEGIEGVLARHVAAIGERDAIDAVRTVRVTATRSQRNIDTPVTWEYWLPDRMRVEFELYGETGVQAYDGSQAWMIWPFGGADRTPRLMDEQTAADFLRDVHFHGPLINAAEQGNEVSLIGPAEVDGAPAQEIEILLPSGETLRYFLGTEDHLAIKRVETRMFDGRPVQYETVYSDYREVAGLRLPHRNTMTVTGLPATQEINARIERIDINPPLSERRFVMPEASAEGG